MPRLARVVAVGVPHHITQRGNNRQPVFLNDFDRRSYCKLLAQWSRRCGIRVLGYCLMTNHVHLVVVPERSDAAARLSHTGSQREAGEGRGYEARAARRAEAYSTVR